MGAETAQQVYNFLETLDKDMHKRHPDLHGDNIMIDKDGHIAIIDRGH
ncbi:MAG: hypothetical protein Q8O99_05835 [bacterium]|nr:hypothetical protein [bacterium]